jgi:hypothetical protein
MTDDLIEAWEEKQMRESHLLTGKVKREPEEGRGAWVAPDITMEDQASVVINQGRRLSRYVFEARRERGDLLTRLNRSRGRSTAPSATPALLGERTG